MNTLSEQIEEIKNDNTKIGDTAPKERNLFDLVKQGNYTANEYSLLQKIQKERTAPGIKYSRGDVLLAGFVDAAHEAGKTPQNIKIWGGQGVLSIGGAAGSKKIENFGRALINAANNEAQAKDKKYNQTYQQIISPEDYSSFSYALGGGLYNYGGMLALGYLSGGLGSVAGLSTKAAGTLTETAGLGSMFAMELGGKTQDKINTYIEKSGDVDLKDYTSDIASKDFMMSAMYASGSMIMEKKFGFGEQRKLFKMPFGQRLKNVAKIAASEGGTELSQGLYEIGVDVAGGYLDYSKLPESFMQALQAGAVGGVLGGGAGIAAAIGHRSQAKAILREQLQNTVPEKDLDNVVDAIYEEADETARSVIAQELVQSEELRNKHGAIYEQIKDVINKQITDAGAYSDVEEAKKAQYIEGEASRFADEVLAEANKRGVTIDDVLTPNDIVYKDGRIYLQGLTEEQQKVRERKRRKKSREEVKPQEDELKAQIEENAPAEEKEQNLNDVVSSYEGAENFDVEAMPIEEKQAVFEAEEAVKDSFTAQEKTTEQAEEVKPQAEEVKERTTYDIMPSGLVRKIVYKDGRGLSAVYGYPVGNAEHTFLTKEEYEAETGKNYDDLVKEQSGDKQQETQEEITPETNEAIQENTLPEVEKEDTTTPDKIEDFGEYLYGARKDLWTGFKEKINKELPENDEDIKLSEAFPEPNYEKLIANGVDVNVLATIKAIRDIIPTKPKNTYSYRFREWAKTVRVFRALTSKIIEGNFSLDVADTLIPEALKNQVQLYRMLGYPYFTKAKGYTLKPMYYHNYGGDNWVMTNIYHEGDKEGYEVEYNNRNVRVNGSYFFENINDGIDEIKSRIDIDLAKGKSKNKTVKFDIYYNTMERGKVFLGKKIRSGKYVDLRTFGSIKEAREYLANNYDTLVEELNKLKQNPMTRGEVNEARVGEDYRKGANATPEMFADTFGFRGVQFGNWVEQKKRINDLNEAYDALIDLSKVLNVPTRAIALNGTLGLAFGARGRGGFGDVAAAHYEPDTVVINLTKKYGAGSLAHEWFHALDNSFMKKDNKQLGYTSEMAMENNPLSHNRPEVMLAFYNLRNALENSKLFERSKEWDKARSEDYWSTIRELGARTFEQYIKDKLKGYDVQNDFLVNILESKDGVYLNPEEKAEIYAAYDKLFNTLKTRETEKGVEFYQFAGEKAQTAALDDLYYAKLMEQDGESKEKILRDTGWFRGADGKWRFEISDKDATIKESGLQELNEGNSVRLEDILGHKDLYKAYPALANIEVKIDESLTGTSTGAYVNGASAEDMTIYVRRGEGEESFRKILLHEIQHDIQTIEGFARGGDTSTVSNEFLEKRNEKIQSERDAFWENKAKELLGKEAKEYLSVRKSADIYSKKLSDTDEKLSKLKREHYWENNTKKREKLDERINKLEEKRREYNREYFSYAETLATKYEEIEDNIYNALKDETKKNPQRYKILDTYMGGLEGYRRLYGEIEARNTEVRSDLTGRERLERTPESTQDVANADAIIVFDDGTSMSYGPQYQSAFAGSRVDYDRPSLEAIGSGEGNQAHGWGLYYALNKDVAEKYRKAFIRRNRETVFPDSSEELAITTYLKNNKDKGAAIKELQQIEKDEYKKFGTKDENVLAYVNASQAQDYLRYANESTLGKGVLEIENSDSGQVHEVDIPENPYLLDEQKPFSEQSDIVKNAIKKLNNEDVNDILDDDTTGEDIYGELVNYFSKQVEGNDLKSKTDNAQKLASQELEKVGIKGITYDGRQDGRCFVIFNPEDVRVIQKFYQGDKVKRGSFDALTKSIKITDKADFSTYAHEFAHYWLDNMWNYANSEMASQNYKDQFNEVKKWLNVKADQTYLTSAQHEKFARGYEKYLYTGNIPNPIIGDVFKDYNEFIKEVYESLEEIDTRAGKKYEPITPVMKEFFDSMITGKIEEKPTEEAQEKQTAETKEVKPRGLAKTTAEMAEQKGIEVEKPTYEIRKQTEMAEKADEFIKNNKQLAIDIVKGLAPEQDGIFRQDLFAALRELALNEGDSDLLNELARSMTVEEATELGQRIQALARGRINPVKEMVELRDERMKKNKVTKEKVKEETKKATKEIENEIALAAEPKEWQEFVKSLEC